ncbi:hypothetical protein BDW22DRAFT_1354565 [Trametopsis cervina]|nr:hypothetical protein BDW22DRAFT_1354565 [Trametopsis cervina]
MSTEHYERKRLYIPIVTELYSLLCVGCRIYPLSMEADCSATDAARVYRAAVVSLGASHAAG